MAAASLRKAILLVFWITMLLGGIYYAWHSVVIGLPILPNSRRALATNMRSELGEFAGQWRGAAEPRCKLKQPAGAPLERRDLSAAEAVDVRIYNTLISLNVTSAKDAAGLPSERLAELEKEFGVSFPVAVRAFTLYDSYLKEYNKCDYPLLRDPGPCGREVKVALIAVQSRPHSFDKRKAIRKRLRRKLLGPGYRVVFVIGRSESLVDNKVKKESDRYKDIIWVDLMEDYDNLTLKTLTTLRWTKKNCLSAHRLVKVDDDVFLNVTNLKTVLALTRNRKRTVMGFIGHDEEASRQMEYKWYMPKYMYDKSTYPPFAHGPCYVLTTDLLEDLSRAAETIKFLHLEDIFLAVCASLLERVEMLNVRNFISKTCDVRDVVAVHGQTCS